uniref:Uncharacterized protein n=1 Tax=Spongospora subterranea TaxID=70186 RepID=A0A0H5QHH5_9EUKA|eukprot:CRZ01112.1 hypothetical protein [Spongospora subterranea]
MDAAFLQLRRKLETAGYSSPLGIESFPLVQKLFKDLQQTQNARDDAIKQSGEEEKSRRQQSETAACLRRENSSLIEANNALHADIIRNTEAMDEIERNARNTVHEANAAANKYRYQFNTSMFKIQTQETDIARLKHKITVLLERSQAYSLSELSRPGSKQSIEIGSGTFNEKEPERPEFVEERRRFGELLDISQSKIATLEAELADAEARCKALSDEKDGFERSMMLKDAEIKRIQSATLSSGTISHPTEQSHQLSEQVDFLTKEMLSLENQLQRYQAMEPLVEELRQQRDRLAEQLQQNEERLASLGEELAAEKRTVKSLNAEKEKDLSNSKARVPRAVRDLEAALKNVRRLEAQVKQLKQEKEDGDKEMKNISKIYQSYSSDKQLLSSLIETAEARATKATESLHQLQKQLDSKAEENVQLSERLSSLKNDVKNLKDSLVLHQQTIAKQQMEIDDERKHGEVAQAKISSLEETIETLSNDGHAVADDLSQAKNENKMLREALQEHVAAAAADSRTTAKEENATLKQTAAIRSLQAERDEYRNQMTHLNDLLVQAKEENLIAERELSAEKNARAHTESQFQSALVLEEESRSCLAQREATVLDLRRQIQELGHEILDKNQQINMLQNLCSSTGVGADRLRETTSQCAELTRQVSDLKHKLEISDNDLHYTQDSLRKITEHRDALLVLFRELDAHLITTQMRVESIIRERDDLKFRYSQNLAELNLRGQSTSEIESRYKQDQQVLLQLKSDNSSLVNVVRQFEVASNANESLIKQLRGSLADLNASKEAIAKDLQQERRSRTQLIGQNSELQSSLDAAQQESVRMKKQIVALQNQIEQQRGTISTCRAECDQLRSLITQLENVKTTETAEAARLRVSLQSSRDEISQRDCHITEVEKKCFDLSNQIETLQHAAKSLDMERDRLCHILDERCEQLAQLQGQMAKDDESVVAAHQNASELENRLQQLNAEHSAALLKLQNYADIFEQLKQNSMALESQLQLKNTEIQAIAEDLGNMSKENQFVNGELAVAVQDRDSKSQEAHAALNKIMYLEELLRVQKREKEDLHSNYRLLCNENKRLLNTASDLDSKCQAQLIEMQRLHERSVYAETQSQQLNDSNGKLRIDLEQYQRQQESLTRSLAAVQEQLDSTRQERSSLLDSLSSTRSLSVGLESDKSQLHRRMLLDQDYKERMQEQIREVEARVQSQAQQTDFFQRRVNELESLLAEQRAQSLDPHRGQDASNDYEQLSKENAKLKQFIVAYERKLLSQETAGSGLEITKTDDAANDFNSLDISSKT